MKDDRDGSIRAYQNSTPSVRKIYTRNRPGVRALTKTIRKALAGLEPKYRRKKDPPCPRMDPISSIVEAWLREDKERPRIQRHTARRVYTRLVEEYKFKGSEATVRRWVRQCKNRLGLSMQQAVIPLDPECAREAEVDWGREV